MLHHPVASGSIVHGGAVHAAVAVIVGVGFIIRLGAFHLGVIVSLNFFFRHGHILDDISLQLIDGLGVLGGGYEIFQLVASVRGGDGVFFCILGGFGPQLVPLQGAAAQISGSDRIQEAVVALLSGGFYLRLFFLGQFIQAQFLGLLNAHKLIHIGIDHLGGDGGFIGGEAGTHAIGGIHLIIILVHLQLVLYSRVNGLLIHGFAVYVHDYPGVVLSGIHGNQRAAAQQQHQRQQQGQ